MSYFPASPSVTQRKQLTARSWDFEAKFYVGPHYKSMLANDFYGLAKSNTIVTETIIIDGIPVETTYMRAIDERDSIDYGTTEVPFSTPDMTGWHEITNRITGLDMRRFAQRNSASWEVEADCLRYDEFQIFADQAVCALIRFQIDGTWTEWNIWFIGFFADIGLETDFEEKREFKARIVGLSHYLNLQLADPMSWGRVNIAKGKSCSWSTTLTEPTALINLGEFTGTQVTLGPENAVDGSVWGPPAVSYDVPIGTNVIEGELTGNMIREVYANPPTGYDYHYQWIAVIGAGKRIRNIVKFGQGAYNYDEFHDWPEDPPYCKSWWDSGAIELDDVLIPLGELAVFCYDRARCEELFDLSSAAVVFEYGPQNPNFIFDPAKDFVAITNAGYGTSSIRDFVAWSSDRAWVPTIPAGSTTGGGCGSTDLAPHWTGATVDSSLWRTGESLARQTYDDDADEWHVNEDTNTRYNWSFIESPNPTHYPKGLWPQWAIIDLGDIECQTSVNFDPTSDTVMYLDTTYGLSPYGVGVINSQRFAYTGRMATSLTGITWHGTSDVIGSGNFVYQYDESTGTAAHGWRISEVRLWRRPMMTHIKIGEIYGSQYPGTLMTPKDATDETGVKMWWTDWPVLGSGPSGVQLGITSDAIKTGLIKFTFPVDSSAPERYRVRQILILCNTMMGNGDFVSATDPRYRRDGGQFMLNEIEVFADDSLTNAREVEASATGASVLRSIITSLGVPSIMVNQASSSALPPFANQSTTQTKSTQVIDSIGAIYGIVTVERTNCTMHIRRNPWRKPELIFNDPASAYVLGPVIAFLDLTSVSKMREQKGIANTVRQAKITARDPEGRVSFIGVFPITASSNDLGDIVTNEGDIFIVTGQSEANQAAEALYYQTRATRMANITVAGFCTWLYPFDLVYTHQIPVGVNTDGVVIYSKPVWIIEEIQESVSFGPLSDTKQQKTWNTTVRAREFSRMPFLFRGNDPIPPFPPNPEADA